MKTTGTVRIWHDEEGWGVIDSNETPGGCWAHFSHLVMPDYRSLEAGQEVGLEAEAAEQDGFSFRATRVWPAGASPEVTPGLRATPGDAYRSGLTIRFEN